MTGITEEKAKTKWCPHVRISNGPDGVWNKLSFDIMNNPDITKRETYNCIGSACMMWRDLGQQREKMRNYHDDRTVNGSSHNYPDGWQYSHTDIDQDNRPFDLLHRIAADDAPNLGYCGLAGEPK